MSSSLAKILPEKAGAATTPPSPQLLTPTTQPIPLLSSSAVARNYNHLHAPLLLVYFLARFNALVAAPLDTMIYDIAVLALAQCAFCALCLPSAGTWGSGVGSSTAILTGTATPSKTSKSSSGVVGGSMRRKPAIGSSSGGGGSAMKEPSWRSRILPSTLSLLLALAVPTIPLTAMALVLGAPIWPYELIPLTALLSVHVSLLAFLPIFYTHGVSASAWRDVVAAWLPFDEAGVWGGTVGCLVGGWLGAVPIALDWDREWQKWPVTVITGCYLGWALGRLMTASARLGVGVRIDLSEDDGGAGSRAVVGKSTKSS